MQKKPKQKGPVKATLFVKVILFFFKKEKKKSFIFKNWNGKIGGKNLKLIKLAINCICIHNAKIFWAY